MKRKAGFMEADDAAAEASQSSAEKTKIKYDRFLLFIPTRNERDPRYNPIMEVIKL